MDAVLVGLLDVDVLDDDLDLGNQLVGKAVPRKADLAVLQRVSHGVTRRCGNSCGAGSWWSPS